eukprot:TRINITY_DN52042_c0_g1_i1.p1 TRINITY_DN52042_c0_g1~~TRINITY_DN52042_c0_g1_i1.p1  ORF type:complete len:906 (+),score=121.18 TRINITY_DN52042_c0_g1_i1:23-2740(+)
MEGAFPKWHDEMWHLLEQMSHPNNEAHVDLQFFLNFYSIPNPTFEAFLSNKRWGRPFYRHTQSFTVSLGRTRDNPRPNAPWQSNRRLSDVINMLHSVILQLLQSDNSSCKLSDLTQLLKWYGKVKAHFTKYSALEVLLCFDAFEKFEVNESQPNTNNEDAGGPAGGDGDGGDDDDADVYVRLTEKYKKFPPPPVSLQFLLATKQVGDVLTQDDIRAVLNNTNNNADGSTANDDENNSNSPAAVGHQWSTSEIVALISPLAKGKLEIAWRVVDEKVEENNNNDSALSLLTPTTTTKKNAGSSTSGISTPASAVDTPQTPSSYKTAEEALGLITEHLERYNGEGSIGKIVGSTGWDKWGLGKLAHFVDKYPDIFGVLAPEPFGDRLVWLKNPTTKLPDTTTGDAIPRLWTKIDGKRYHEAVLSYALSSLDQVETICYSSLATRPVDLGGPMLNNIGEQVVSWCCFLIPNMAAVRRWHDTQQEVFKAIIRGSKDRYHKDNARLQPFGSVAMHLARANSDLDLVFVVDYEHKNGDFTRREVQEHIVHIYHALRESPKLFPRDTMSTVLSASVPLVHRAKSDSRGWQHGLEFDISLSWSGVRNSVLIRHYVHSNLCVVQPLIMVINTWAKSQGITGTRNGYLSSYCLCIITLFFLIKVGQVKHIPIDTQLDYSEDAAEYRYAAPNNCDNKLLGELFVQFLEYYAEFPWQKDVITLRLGGGKVIPRQYKIDTDHWKEFEMGVEDPFETHLNTARFVQKRQAEMIKEAFQAAIAQVTTGKGAHSLDRLFSADLQEVKKQVEQPPPPQQQHHHHHHQQHQQHHRGGGGHHQSGGGRGQYVQHSPASGHNNHNQRRDHSNDFPSTPPEPHHYQQHHSGPFQHQRTPPSDPSSRGRHNRGGGRAGGRSRVHQMGN